MSNRGRHKRKKEKYTIRIIQGMHLPCYKYTITGMTYLRNIRLFKFYKIFINEQHEVCRIEEDIKNPTNI